MDTLTGLDSGYFAENRQSPVSYLQLKFLFFRVSKDLSIRASYGSLQMSQFPLGLYSCLTVMLEMKFGGYIYVPIMTI